MICTELLLPLRSQKGETFFIEGAIAGYWNSKHELESLDTLW